MLTFLDCLLMTVESVCVFLGCTRVLTHFKWVVSLSLMIQILENGVIASLSWSSPQQMPYFFPWPGFGMTQLVLYLYAACKG